MTKQKIVVKGGGENLYFISQSLGVFYVYKGSVWGSDKQIGTTKTKHDAISLIRSHSGREIDHM